MENDTTQKPPSMIPLIRKFAADRAYPLDFITGRGRTQEAVTLRRELIVLLHDAGFAIGAIARRLDRDHTTILHYLGRLNRRRGERGDTRRRP